MCSPQPLNIKSTFITHNIHHNKIMLFNAFEKEREKNTSMWQHRGRFFKNPFLNTTQSPHLMASTVSWVPRSRGPSKNFSFIYLSHNFFSFPSIPSILPSLRDPILGCERTKLVISQFIEYNEKLSFGADMRLISCRFVD